MIVTSGHYVRAKLMLVLKIYRAFAPNLNLQERLLSVETSNRWCEKLTAFSPIFLYKHYYNQSFPKLWIITWLYSASRLELYCLYFPCNRLL